MPFTPPPTFAINGFFLLFSLSAAAPYLQSFALIKPICSIHGPVRMASDEVYAPPPHPPPPKVPEGWKALWNEKYQEW